MATQQAPATTGAQPFMKGSIIWQKRGPLPVWAWALLGLLLLLVIVWWRRNREPAGDDAEATTGFEQLPGDQTAPPVFVVPQAPNPSVNVTVPVTATVPTAPPGGGQPGPPKVPPKMPAPKPAPTGGVVKVTRYPDRTPPRESTLWDIAHAWLPQGAEQWRLIWRHPLNADIAKRRKAPEKIQPGDPFFVPGKLKSFRR